MKSIITTIAFIFVLIIGYAQNNEFAKLDQFLSVLEEEDRFFGSIAVSRGGEMVYQHAIGHADMAAKIANDTKTKFRVGSISKTFTATLIMKAVELGMINLDDTVDAYFPNLQNADKMTIRHLLNHRSGIKNFTDKSFFAWYTKPITPTALLDTIVQKGINFEPNSKFEYSNSNYVLLTFVLEDAFDTTYPKLLREYITQPLGLQHTGYGSKIQSNNNEALSYHLDTEWAVEPQGDMSIPLGAGGIVSTPTDLCIFLRALFDDQLISSESFEQMKPVGEDYYGFALYTMPFADRIGLGHGGNIDAFVSDLIYFEEQDICIAISSNGSNYLVNDVMQAVMSELFDEPYDIPSFEFVEMTDEALQAYVGVYETEELPLDLTVTVKDQILYLQATGQSAGALTAEGGHDFSAMKHSVKITFVPEENKMHFAQGAMEVVFTLKDPTTKETVQTKVPVDTNLDAYVGVYASHALPMDLTISAEGDRLKGQGTGQQSFELLSIGDHQFSNQEIGLTITFIPEEKKMNFVQGAAAFEMNLVE